MANHPSFPSFLTALPGLPDGTLEASAYLPQKVLAEDTRWELSQILAEARDFEDEEENAAVLADWLFVERQEASALTLRSHISFFRDGSDGAEKQGSHWVGAGVLFYREDFLENLADPRAQKPLHTRVHIPDQDAQDRLIDAWGYQAALLRGDRSLVETIVNYLASILNDQSAWVELSSL